MISMELLVAMIIIISITTMSVIAGSSLIDSARVSRLSSDFKSYSQAAKAFQDIYGNLPGDIGSNNSFSSLSSTEITNNITLIENINCGDNCTMSNMIVTEQKAPLSFQQMEAVNVLKANIDTTYTLTSNTINTINENYAKLIKVLFPAISFSKSATTILISEANGNDIDRYFIIFNTINYSNGGEFLVENGNLDNGVIPATIASELDFKIDDGNPNSGFIQAQNGLKSPPTTGVKYCTDGNVYTNNSSFSASESCLVKYFC